jgi:peptide-methionine (S)-S-oxide reductase
MKYLRAHALLMSMLGLTPLFSAPADAAAPTQQIAVFAGGCFWGVDAVFKHVKGVTEVVSGYSGGAAATANYDQVSMGNTGHAESVQVRFNPAQVSYAQLLQVFFTVAHNPTELDHQGPDSGTQYRSAIFYTTPEQMNEAHHTIQKLTESGSFSSPIVTQVVPLQQFYAAEEHHQNYLAQHPNQPYIVINDTPKVAQLRKLYPTLFH